LKPASSRWANFADDEDNSDCTDALLDRDHGGDSRILLRNLEFKGSSLVRKIITFGAVPGINRLAVCGGILVLLGGVAQAQLRPIGGAASERSADATPAANGVSLKFFNADWPTILQKVADESGSTLVMHEIPPGHWTRRDKTPYTRHEAVQILNRELEPEGFRILEKNEFLIVVHQRSLRTRYRRPERPTEPEWQADAAPRPQFTEAELPKRSVTPIATREQQRSPQQPGQIRLASDAQPVPASEPAKTSAANPIAAAPAPPALQSALPEGWTHTALTPQSPVRDLAGTLYKAHKLRAELVDAGVAGLPAFRVIFPAAKNGAVEGFEVAIDISKNQIVIASDADRVKRLTSLFQTLDRENNAFEQPIQLVAADEETAKLADQLTPRLNRLAREAEKAPARISVPAADAQPGDFGRDWALAQVQPPAQAQPQPNQNQPQNNQPPGQPQVVPVQPVDGIQALVANFRGQVQIQTIPELGIMILIGNKADVDALIQIIQQIQTQTAGVAPDVDLLLLENLDASALADLLRTVYEQLATIRTRTGQPRQSVSFIPLARPNAVMILAPKVEIESIRELAIKLDQPLDPEADIEVFYLKHAIATQAATALNSTFQAQAAAAAGATAPPAVALQPRLQVVADVRTNSLIVQARPNDMKKAAMLIDKLDGVGDSVSEMRVIPLTNAVADELANVITSTIQGLLNPPNVTGTPPQGQATGQIGQTGQGPQELRDAKAVILDFLSDVGEQERTVRSGILADIRVQPDIRSNSLIVTAPKQSMEMMVALINQLDQPTTTVAEIKVFTLENADAASMIDLLTTLFTQEDTAAQPGVNVVGAEDASSGLIPLRFSVDVRTNSIIAIGGGDALRVVEAILLRLDESDVQQRKTTVIKLRNSPATEVAAAINTFLQSQRELATIDPELVSNIELLEREIIAVAEPVSNSLLISATPRYYAEIQELIQKLDEEPPQVVIQALLVEVTLDDTDEFGVELGFQDDILFDRSLTPADGLVTIPITNTLPNGTQTTSTQIISQETVPGFRFTDLTTGLGNNVSASPNILGSQSVSNFSLGRINNDLGYGGLVLSASSNQVSVLLRALSGRRQVHVLSRPQIRTLDNQVAQIQVGQQVPVVDGVTFQGANNSAFPLVRQDNAGIILTVTPRISPEENIVMEVVAEKSAFTGAGVTIFVDSVTGNQITSPIKDITTARSVIGVPNGQTVVLGGMITKNDETIERKVPWLGDVPYLGLPFRYDSTRTRRTELLIFLTPRIVRGDADNELIKQVEAERLHWVEQEAEEIHGPIFAIPGQQGYPEWMQGSEFCPPWEMGTDDVEATPAPGHDVPAPALPLNPQQPGPRVPLPDGSMGLRQDNRSVPTTVVPAGGFTQTSNETPGPPMAAQRPGRQTAPAKTKKPWYSLSKR
jgi:general secretion pathway protein D